MVRQNYPPAPIDPFRYEPMYGWALDSAKRPVPITLAERGAQGYQCPICQRPMIAKKGEIKQHHFAHEIESLADCTPDEIARAIAGTWLVLELGERMALHLPCFIEWSASGQTYKADLLKGVRAIVERKAINSTAADIALMHNGDRPRCVIMLNLAQSGDTLAFSEFTARSIPVISLPSDLFRSGQVTLKSLLAASQVHGGWWLVDQNDRLPVRLESEPQQLQQVLRQVVSRPPYRFWGPLTNLEGHQHVLRIGQHMLWLPPELWQIAVGGIRNRMSNELTITTQEWPEADGSVIALYYIHLGKSQAVAVRRFQAGEPVQASLPARFRMKKMTAEEVARLLVSN